MPYIRVRLETWTVLIGGTILTTAPCPCMESAARLKQPNFASLILDRISFEEEWPLFQKCFIFISNILILLFIIYLMNSTTGIQTVLSIFYWIQIYKRKRTEPTCHAFSNAPSTKLYKMTNIVIITLWPSPSWSVNADFPAFLSACEYVCGNSHRRKDKYDFKSHSILVTSFYSFVISLNVMSVQHFYSVYTWCHDCAHNISTRKRDELWAKTWTAV